MELVEADERDDQMIGDQDHCLWFVSIFLSHKTIIVTCSLNLCGPCLHSSKKSLCQKSKTREKCTKIFSYINLKMKTVDSYRIL